MAIKEKRLSDDKRFFMLKVNCFYTVDYALADNCSEAKSSTSIAAFLPFSALHNKSASS